MPTKGEVTRGKIIDEATRVFHRKGFLTTTINDLLEATGTTRSLSDYPDRSENLDV